MVRRKLSSKFKVLAALGLTAASAIAACSTQDTNHEFTSSSSAGSDNSGGASAGSSAGGHPSSGSDVGGGTFVGSTSISSAATGLDPDAGCASTSSKAEQIPLDIFIMLDQSGSMSDPVAGGGTKWKAVTQALATFVIQPSLTGVSVGLGYFGVPPGAAACPLDCVGNNAALCTSCGGFCSGNTCSPLGGDSCDKLDYAKPEVEIAPLPGISGAIVTSLSKHMPNTGTPTSAALEGAILHASDWEKAHPTHLTIVVFATDGDPGECDTNLANINAIAAAGVNGNPKILTFVIGVGPSLQALDGIAAAGGTMTAFHVDTNGNANQQFLDAMNQIRKNVLSCSYLIPKPSMGMLDYDKVNVQYTPGGGGMPITIPNVTNKAACPPNGLGWFYDNNASPQKIILCDDTCNTLTMDPQTSLEIVLGCKTVIN